MVTHIYNPSIPIVRWRQKQKAGCKVTGQLAWSPQCSCRDKGDLVSNKVEGETDAQKLSFEFHTHAAPCIAALVYMHVCVHAGTRMGTHTH